MNGAPASAESDARAVVASARAGEPDRYLAALLAPRGARDALLALAAFAAEVGRVPALVTREPAMGDIRLQWWRDALRAPADQRTGHPVADALRRAMQRHALPLDLLEFVIEARGMELEPEPFADDAALERYLWQSEGALFALAGRVVGVPPSADADAGPAGRAYGLARLLMGLPRALSQGRVPISVSRLQAAGLSPASLAAGEAGAAGVLAELRADAREHLAAARQHVAKLPRGLRTAFLPLALVEPYLRTMELPGVDPLREGVEIAPLTRVVRIAAAHWLGRL